MKKFFSTTVFIVLVYCIYLSVFSQEELKGSNLHQEINVQNLNSHNTNNVSNIFEDYIKNDSSEDIDPVEVSNLYVLGKVPIPWGLPDTLYIRVKKNVQGYLPIDVYVQVVNSSSSITMENVTYHLNNNNIFDTILCHRLFTPVEIQTDLVIVEALPGDSAAPFEGDPSNDKLKYCYNITEEEYSHADPCGTDDGGAGFDGRKGNLVAGFRNKSSTNFYVNEIDHCFFDFIGQGNNPYKIVIYGDNGSGRPGLLLYISQTMTSPSGTGSAQRVRHEINEPVRIPPNSKFFVGYRQTSTANIKASYQNENPIRANSFYFSSSDTGNTWYDFKDSSKNYNLDICAIGGGGLLNLTVIPEGLFDLSSYSLTMQDTVRAYLRQTSFPYQITGSTKGTINPITFSKIFTFGNIPTGTYYLVVKHRNSIQTWSHVPISYTNGGMATFDFTISISQAYGNNMVEVDNFQFAIFSGDVNQDGSIDATDLLLIDNNTFNFASGYLSTDLNGDNFTDASDALFIDNNVFNFVGVQGP